MEIATLAINKSPPDAIFIFAREYNVPQSSCHATQADWVSYTPLRRIKMPTQCFLRTRTFPTHSRQTKNLGARNTNLVAKKDLGRCSFPASIASCGNEEATCWIQIQCADDAGSMPGHDEKWDSGFILGVLLFEIVEAKDII